MAKARRKYAKRARVTHPKRYKKHRIVRRKKVRLVRGKGIWGDIKKGLKKVGKAATLPITLMNPGAGAMVGTISDLL